MKKKTIFTEILTYFCFSLNKVTYGIEYFLCTNCYYTKKNTIQLQRKVLSCPKIVLFLEQEMLSVQL